MREDVRAALSLAVERLPGMSIVLYTRAPLGDRRFTWVTGDTGRVLGLPRGALTSEPGRWRDALHPADRDRVDAALSDVVAHPSKDRTNLRYRIRDESGEERWVVDDVRVLRSRDGAPTELLGVVRDVTERHRLEMEVEALQARLAESLRMEALGALAGGIAHDFNNLLTTILSAADLLEEGAEMTWEAREDLNAIRDSARRGSAMVRQILDFAARGELSPSELDAGLVLEEMVPLLERTVGAHISLEIEHWDELPPIQADRARLEQVILNLVVNAREAMRGGGTITIAMAAEEPEEDIRTESHELPPGPYLRLSVRDDGPGIPDDVRSRIFEPFFSTKGGREGSEGSGIGLPTVLRIVQGYGGGIRIESEPRSGTACHVYLPVGRERISESSPEQLQSTRPARGQEGRILLVEDDSSVRHVVERTLTDAGYAVLAVGTARQGLKAFDRVRPPFDLLLTDVVLPDRSGPELFRALARRTPKLRVLYMSGYGPEVLRRRGVREPGAELLSKPFTPETLKRRVREILRPGAGGQGPRRETGSTGA